ncbi:MAG: putative DNA-binding domain-containing protein [Xanthomonadaceae bacterium]|nr:putative DNA-binding domain-containing protein [Xanthomonadaceae bacterium]
MPAVLLETQRRFLAALYDDDESGPVVSIAGNGLEPSARLRIYRHSCNEIQTGSLRITYPALLALVGGAFFDQSARGYRNAYPSRSGNLQAFGKRFADYLAVLPAVRSLDYIADVARLEWLRQESALSDGSATLPPGGFDLVGLHPSVRLLASRYPVLTIWRYAMQPRSGRLKLPTTCERVMLWREQDQVAMTALDPASFACVESLARGNALADAHDAGRLQDPDFDFAACTASLVDRGLLVMRAALDSHEETLPCRSCKP